MKLQDLQRAINAVIDESTRLMMASDDESYRAFVQFNKDTVTAWRKLESRLAALGTQTEVR